MINMEKEYKIEKLDHLARGITYLNNKVTFIPKVLPKEVVEIKLKQEKKHFNEAEIVKIKQESPQRRTSLCPYYQKCGGCQLLHLSYEDNLLFKKNKITEIFHKFKITIPEIKVIKNENNYNYRNKIELKVRDGKIGFYQADSHEIIEIDKCLVAMESLNLVLNDLRKLKINFGEIILRTNHNDEVLIIIKTAEKILISQNDFVYKKIAGIVLNNKTIFGDNYLMYQISKYIFKCSYDAFFQINNYICEKLFNYLEDNVTGNNLLDLYCGVGTLGIIASKKVSKVFGLEIISNAIKDALVNQKINKVPNIYFLLGDVAENIKKIKAEIDFLIIDPPRSGINKKTLAFLFHLPIQEIIYISCDPMTLARDINILQENFKIQDFNIFDMFSYTYHVECVVKLCRREIKGGDKNSSPEKI